MCSTTGNKNATDVKAWERVRDAQPLRPALNNALNDVCASDIVGDGVVARVPLWTTLDSRRAGFNVHGRWDLARRLQRRDICQIPTSRAVEVDDCVVLNYTGQRLSLVWGIGAGITVVLSVDTTFHCNFDVVNADVQVVTVPNWIAAEIGGAFVEDVTNAASMFSGSCVESVVGRSFKCRLESSCIFESNSEFHSHCRSWGASFFTITELVSKNFCSFIYPFASRFVYEGQNIIELTMLRLRV